MYFFKYFLLLALISEFNCFLRSRCSMEMWCPDDIGRDSWDWVGPPAWGRACFNSPEWGGGSSPVQTEPLQIVLLLLCVVLCVVVVLLCVLVCCCCAVVVLLCCSGTHSRSLDVYFNKRQRINYAMCAGPPGSLTPAQHLCLTQVPKKI